MLAFSRPSGARRRCTANPPAASVSKATSAASSHGQGPRCAAAGAGADGAEAGADGSAEADGATSGTAIGGALGLATGAGRIALGAGRGGAVSTRGTRLADALGRASGVADGLATGSTITGSAADGAADFGAIGVGATPLSSAGPAARGGARVGTGSRKVEGFSLWSGAVCTCAQAPPPRVKAAAKVTVNASAVTAYPAPPRQFRTLTLFTSSCSLKSRRFGAMLVAEPAHGLIHRDSH